MRVLSPFYLAPVRSVPVSCGEKRLCEERSDKSSRVRLRADMSVSTPHPKPAALKTPLSSVRKSGECQSQVSRAVRQPVKQTTPQTHRQDLVTTLRNSRQSTENYPRKQMMSQVPRHNRTQEAVTPGTSRQCLRKQLTPQTPRQILTQEPNVDSETSPRNIRQQTQRDNCSEGVQSRQCAGDFNDLGMEMRTALTEITSLLTNVVQRVERMETELQQQRSSGGLAQVTLVLCQNMYHLL